MIQKIKQRVFPFLIALSALSVSASAAFYSISGLSKLFAGAAFAVILMASSLEFAKLVIASLLYQYRKTLPKFLKYYLSISCFILILITSIGIYGFLSAAYQETASKSGNVEAQIALVEVKRDNVKNQLFVYNDEKKNINNSVAGLRSGLSNNVIRYTDTLGNVVTTTSSSTRRASNFAFARLTPITKKNLYREIVPITEKPTTPPHILEDEGVEIDWEAAEKRMNIIAQNGNDGEHYQAYTKPLIKVEPIDDLDYKISLLEEKIRNTSRANKSGEDGWANLQNKLSKLIQLKNKGKNNDDLIKKY